MLLRGAVKSMCIRPCSAGGDAGYVGCTLGQLQGLCQRAVIKISEISAGIQMERSVSVSSDRNIRDYL